MGRTGRVRAKACCRARAGLGYIAQNNGDFRVRTRLLRAEVYFRAYVLQRARVRLERVVQGSRVFSQGVVEVTRVFRKRGKVRASARAGARVWACVRTGRQAGEIHRRTDTQPTDTDTGRSRGRQRDTKERERERRNHRQRFTEGRKTDRDT